MISKRWLGRVLAVSVAVLVAAGSVTALAAEGDTSRISVNSGEGQATGDAGSERASISGNGRYVAFYSGADNLVGDSVEGFGGVYVRDTQTGETELVSRHSDGTAGTGFIPVISADGRYVAFDSDDKDLVDPILDNFTNYVFIHDRQTGETTLVSRHTDGTPAETFTSSNVGSISADGRYVAFSSDATNLVDESHVGLDQLYVHDTVTGKTTLVSTSSNGVPGNDSSFEPKLSADGSYLAFSSYASNLVPNDTNDPEDTDIFWRDLVTGETVLASTASNGAQADDESNYPGISGDGRYVVFDSEADNLGGGLNPDATGVYIHDAVTAETVLLSVDSAGKAANGTSYRPSISADGRVVVYDSTGFEVPAGASSRQVVAHDLATDESFFVSVSSGSVAGNQPSSFPAVSGDGSFIAFHSLSSNLVAGDTNAIDDVFVHHFALPEDNGDPGDPGDAGFTDTVGHIFAADIDALAESGITKGCNPPTNDRFCPDDVVTRGQMAAFLKRAMNLPSVGGQGFTDTSDSVFVHDIDALAQAGITKGCNPPTNDRFCPDDQVTRGQMAAFLVRALDLPSAPDQGFTDTSGGVFVHDIDALAQAGITKGCNPPTNDRFCPDDPVTRGQMAAFLNRALDLG